MNQFSCVERFHLVACLFAAGLSLASHSADAELIALEMVTVGDPGNEATTGYGGVATSYKIMKYEFTNADYVTFLNASDPTGANTYGTYNAAMGSDARGGISYTSGNANGTKYAVRSNMGDKPVNFVSWFDGARVSNWMTNGQGVGSTETGSYTLVDGQTPGIAPAANANALFYIPTEDQWYKAAYYKGGGLNAGYWNYATQSDLTPATVTSGSTGIGSAGSTGNSANYSNGADWNAQDGNVTTVGTNGGASFYGAFDMSGNV
ncbi:MAG: SUMF1/EgtB/PvdO family nonheme iron enzyme, partial [Planctomycetota bacterium]